MSISLRQAARTLSACALMAAILCGCASLVSHHEPPSLAEAKERVSRYVKSGQYDADVAAVVDQARHWLEARAARGGRLAIVLDIDETALSNLALLKLNDWGMILRGATNTATGPCGLLEWIEQAKSKPIPPTLELTRRAHEHGVAVFFITARPERLRAATEKNLRAAGYEWTGLMLKPPQPSGAPRGNSESEYKTSMRKLCVDQGYTIILNMGDQASDLAGGLAERPFKLPNPFYLVP